MRKTILTAIFILLCSPLLMAQQLPLLDNYLFNPYSLAPSFAGKTYKFESYLTYRRSWTGLSGSPTVGFLSLDGNVGKNMGVGGKVQFSTAGIYDNFMVNLAYSYHLPLAKFHTLSFGLDAAIYQNSVDLSEVVVGNPQDPILAGRDKITETYVNMGFSMIYSWKELNVGFAFPMLINNRSLYIDTEYNHLLGVDRNWLIYANYTLTFSTPWKLKFDLLYRDTQFSPWTIDFSTMVKYMDNYWLGLFYRKNNIFGVTAGLAIAGSFVINYNYEFSGYAMGGQGGGSHEISIGYRLPFSTKVEPELKDYNR